MLNTQDKLFEKYKELRDKVEAEIDELESLGGYRKSFLEQLSLDAREKSEEGLK